MSWVATGAVAVSTVTGMLGSRKAEKAERARLAEEASRQRMAAAAAERDLFARTNAANAQGLLLHEREQLAEQAESEAERQARLMVGPDISINTVDPRDRTARRRKFFEPSEGDFL